MRPQSLAEVAQLTAKGDSFDRCLANFLDDFYTSPKPESLSAEPQLLAPTRGGSGRVQDAYLAVTAEHLACTRRLPVPAWVTSEERKLHGPWFVSQLADMCAVLLLEGPPAFRSRSIFVSENALARA